MSEHFKPESIPQAPQSSGTPDNPAPVDQTVRLQAGEPTPPEGVPIHEIITARMHDTQQVPVESLPPTPSPASSSQPLPVLFPDPTVTVIPGQALPTPEASPAPQPPAPAPRRSGLWLGVGIGVVVVLIVLAAVGYFGYQAGWFGEKTETQEEVFATPKGQSTIKGQPGPTAQVTPAIEPYLKRAEAGDVTAMQMLGHLYYYGLDVPQNREEGLRWYRKAADAGSVSARKTLESLEGKAK